MKTNKQRSIVNRTLKEAKYIIRTGATIRETAEKMKVSKSTVYKDVTERLWGIDEELAIKVRKILNWHVEVRHIRGGEATRLKYLKLKEKENE